MKIISKMKRDDILEFFGYNFERIFPFWLISSWIILLIGYSFLVVASTLFSNAPVWIEVFGLTGIYITAINFFVALFIAGMYMIKGLKDKDMDLIKSKTLVIIVYNLAAGTLYIASII